LIMTIAQLRVRFPYCIHQNKLPIVYTNVQCKYTPSHKVNTVHTPYISSRQVRHYVHCTKTLKLRRKLISKRCRDITLKSQTPLRHYYQTLTVLPFLSFSGSMLLYHSVKRSTGAMTDLNPGCGLSKMELLFVPMASAIYFTFLNFLTGWPMCTKYTLIFVV
jgi:hypothetical protein